MPAAARKTFTTPKNLVDRIFCFKLIVLYIKLYNLVANYYCVNFKLVFMQYFIAKPLKLYNVNQFPLKNKKTRLNQYN